MNLKRGQDFQSRLLPLVFKEEAYYGIRRLFNLWEVIARELAAKDVVFSDLLENMQHVYQEDIDYESVCFDLLCQALEGYTKKTCPLH